MAAIQLQASSPFDVVERLTKAVSVSNRTWVRNGIGTASLFIPFTEPYFDTFVEYGTILRIRERGLPPWVGVAVSRSWSEQGVTLGCKSAEWLLTGKLTSQGRVYGGQSAVTAGSVALDLFQNAAVQNNRIRNLKPGLFDAPAPVFREYDYSDLYEALDSLAEDTGSDFWVDEQLQLHFRASRGVDRSSGDGMVVLRERLHLVNVQVEDNIEDMFNAVIALGKGSETAERPKTPLFVPHDRLFRATSLSVTDAETAERTEAAAREFLRANSFPRVVVDATLVNVNGPGMAWNLPFWVGDTIKLVLHNKVHRNVNVKVTGLEVTGDTMRAVFEVIPPSLTVNAQPWTLA